MLPHVANIQAQRLTAAGRWDVDNGRHADSADSDSHPAGVVLGTIQSRSLGTRDLAVPGWRLRWMQYRRNYPNRARSST